MGRSGEVVLGIREPTWDTICRLAGFGRGCDKYKCGRGDRELACTAVKCEVTNGRAAVAARAGVLYAYRSAVLDTLPELVTGSASNTWTMAGT